MPAKKKAALSSPKKTKRPMRPRREDRAAEPPLRPQRTRDTGPAGYLDELYKEGLAAATRYREQALVNEAYIHGDQWDVVISQSGKRSVRKDAWYDDEDIPRIAVNEIGPAHQTWSALMTKSRPTVTAAPSNDSPEAAYKAAIGNVIIDFLEAELDSANKVHKATSFAGMHGTAGLKVCYVARDDKVTWSRLTIFDFVLDPTNADWREAQWVIFEDYVRMDDAIEAFESAKLRRKPTLVEYSNAVGDKLKGVRRLELWHRPCRKYPRGCYTCVVDGELVEHLEEYPYIFADDSGVEQFPLPLALMRVREIRDCVYGGASVSAAVPMQHSYNEMVSRIQKELRDRKTHLFLPDTCEDTYLEGTTAIFFPVKAWQAANVAKYLVANDPPESLFKQRDFFREMIPTTIGLNQVTAGTESRSLSGRAIDNIVELDEQKNADATKEQLAMVRDAWALAWKLVGKFYTDLRKAKIANASPEDVFAFNQTDVDGSDVRLEPASELDKLAAAKKLALNQDQQQGVATTAEAEAATTDGSVGFAQQQTEQIIQSWLAGGPLDVQPDDVNLNVSLEVVQKHMARALARRDQATWVKLEQLRRQLQQLNAQAADTAPAPPAGDASAAPPPA